eukprot:2089137-Prymnesium_polylepis.1
MCAICARDVRAMCARCARDVRDVRAQGAGQAVRVRRVAGGVRHAGPRPLEPGTQPITSLADTAAVARVITRPLAFRVRSSATTPVSEYASNVD